MGRLLYKIKYIALIRDHLADSLRAHHAFKLQSFPLAKRDPDTGLLSANLAALNALPNEANDFIVKSRVLRHPVKHHTLDAAYLVAVEVVRTARVQQQTVLARHEVRARLAHVGGVSVFLDEAVAEIRVDEGVADADEVEVRGNEDKDANTTCCGFWKATDGGQQRGVEVLETRVGVCKVRGRIEA